MKNLVSWRLRLLVSFLMLTTGKAGAQAPGWAWVKSLSRYVCEATAVDDAGQVYMVGNFKGTATFGKITLTSAGETDLFLAKLTRRGTYEWATRIGGSQDESGADVAVDSRGQVTITGWSASPTIRFGATMLPAGGFVARLTAAGTWQWAVPTSDLGAIAVDASGSTYMGGAFESPTITFGATTLTNPNRASLWHPSSAYLVKLTAAGTYEWAVRCGADYADDCNPSDTSIRDVTVDNEGNVIITGDFANSTTTFGPFTLSNSQAADRMQKAFVAKLTAAGAWQWAVGLGDRSGSSNSVAVDNGGNVYVAGLFGIPPFGTATLAQETGHAVFIIKLTPTGNRQWGIGTSAGATGMGIALDQTGNVYVTGSFYGTEEGNDLADTTTFGLTRLVINYAYTNYGNVFAAKLTTAGTWEWAVQAGGRYDDSGVSAGVDRWGALYVTGRFTRTASFGRFTLSTNLDVGEESHSFIGRVSE